MRLPRAALGFVRRPSRVAREEDARDAFVSLRAAAIRCQAFARGAMARRAFLLQKRRRAATVVQARWRGWSTRRRVKVTLGPRVAELAALSRGPRAIPFGSISHPGRQSRSGRRDAPRAEAAPRGSRRAARPGGGDAVEWTVPSGPGGRREGDGGAARHGAQVRPVELARARAAAAYALFENLSADATCARALFECRDP